MAFIAGLALSRLLYEGFFPQLLWLARPLVALPFAALTAYAVWLVWLKWARQLPPLAFSSLLLNLLWLFNPAVDLAGSRLIFAATVWLTAVFIWTQINTDERRWGKWGGWLLVMVALLPVYLFTMSASVGAADTFEFQVVTPQLGIVHPTGYPLYLLLGKLFTLLPVGTLAWRLNLASAVYALAAMSMLYFLIQRMLRHPLPAILGTAVTGLSLTFWSQAIIAEVYALHALIVMVALYLMAKIGDWKLEIKDWRLRVPPPHPITPSPVHVYALAFTLGLGMANHLTTLLLLPSAFLTILFTARPTRLTTHHASRITDNELWITDYRFWLKTAVAFLLPLLLYAYLPLRWQAVNGEAMGLARFVDWVVGGRFQGALQLRAWLDDPVRYQIVGRLFLENWGWWGLALAGLGLVVMVWRQWQTAVILLLTWFAYTFYALNYTVPDLAVFVIPAQLVGGVWWAVGLWAGLALVQDVARREHWPDVAPLALTFALIPALTMTVNHWAKNDQSGENPLEQWGRAVLALPLAEGAAILADSEKIAPLLYLQVAEGLRPDLDISVWPDEAAYRTQVDGRLAQNQAVYLARYLPGLQGIYHLRSLGPLTEVSTSPMTQLPNPSAVPGQVYPITPLPHSQFGPLTLLAYSLEPMAAGDEGNTAVTLYWQAAQAVDEVLHVYVRVVGGEGDGRATHSQHPANNFYPTNAWRPGEIVADYHLLPRPVITHDGALTYQVAIAPPFTPANQLAWQDVTTMEVTATENTAALPSRLLRAQIGGYLVNGADFPAKIRSQTRLPLLLTGFGSENPGLQFKLQPVSSPIGQITEFSPPPPVPPAHIWYENLNSDLPAGLYNLIASYEAQHEADCGHGRCLAPASYCGWMSPAQTGCVVGQVEISGVALPDTAVNYADQIALLDITTSGPALSPGGVLQVQLNWLALANMNQDYTLFLQVVDAQDRIVGQVDSWPVQGTHPTSGWQPGQTIPDSYTIPLSQEMAPGAYRLLVGWYLLGDGRRLPVLDGEGTAVEDKLIVPNLFVPG
ncbi:MAG: DUF2723 domain-containing protein [Chloroflexi bacterium]|nr:DUF2723 domain-containing protein [Ardenticatenaceae bacterium]NOG34318.1 DUF2723 domain-containing protein [Chloroflexota bacterium]